MAKWQESDANNTRYLFELRRTSTREAQIEFDHKFGGLTFVFLTSLQSLASIAYVTIAITLLRNKFRTKTNVVIAIWALLNFLVVSEKVTTRIVQRVDDNVSSDLIKCVKVVSELLEACGRTYGTLLYIIWFVNRFWKTFKPKYDLLLNFLAFFPLTFCTAFIAYYFLIDEYVHQAYTPGSDIVNLLTYFVVTIFFIICQVTQDECYNHSVYVLLISLMNFITNFPICLFSVYLRFVLDITWVYTFHIYFVDIILSVIACSNAFIGLLVIFLYIKHCDKYSDKGFGGKREKVVLLEEITV